jgi:hypothetical protein
MRVHWDDAFISLKKLDCEFMARAHGDDAFISLKKSECEFWYDAFISLLLQVANELARHILSVTTT